jgi:hypothetical protein
LGEAAVEVIEVSEAGERGCLVDDRLRSDGDDGLPHRLSVEQVEHDRLRPEFLQAFGLLARAGAADHLVAPFEELGDEPYADRAGRPCNEDSHRSLLRRLDQADRRLP